MSICLNCSKDFRPPRGASAGKYCSRTCYWDSVVGSGANRRVMIRGTKTKLCRTICERAIGHSLDRRHPIHHFDENPANNTNTNLVICEDQAYHRLLHYRQDIVRAGGNPDIEKYCWYCERILPFSAFYVRPNGKVGSGCKECHRVKALERCWRTLAFS